MIPGRRAPKHRPRVMVVEDEAILAFEIAQTLAAAGFDIIGPAHSVAQALLLMDKGFCDLAVLDINLKGETSEQVALRLLNSATPFVVLSSLSSRDFPPVYKRATAALAKPIQPELLVKVVWRCAIGGAAWHGE